jgi:hypothetical protein
LWQLKSIPLTKPLLLAAAGLLMFSLVSKAQQIGRLIFYPGKVKSIDMLNLSMSIELIVQNTNSSQLYVQSFAGNLFSNSYLIGNVSSFQQIMIPGNSQRIFIVNVKLQPLGVVNDIINAFQTGSFTQFLKLDASANVDGVQLPVQLEFKVGL